MSDAILLNEGSAGDTEARKSVSYATAHSPLFKLPAELRNRIYGHVVICNSAIDLVQIAGNRAARSTRQWEIIYDSEQALEQPALTQTCVTVRSETLPMFYGLNRFKGSLLRPDVLDTAITLKWLSAIRRHRVLLRRFTAEWYEAQHVTQRIRRELASRKIKCEVGTVVKGEGRELSTYGVALVGFEVDMGAGEDSATTMF